VNCIFLSTWIFKVLKDIESNYMVGKYFNEKKLKIRIPRIMEEHLLISYKIVYPQRPK